MDTSRTWAAPLAREPRGGLHAWIPILGGLLVVAYGVYAVTSGGPAGLSSVVVGFVPITVGLAELLPADRAETAGRVRAASVLWLPVYLAVVALGG